MPAGGVLPEGLREEAPARSNGRPDQGARRGRPRPRRDENVTVAEIISSFQAEPSRAGLFLDFDGSLSEIVPRPQEAGPVEGARDVVEALAARFALVAVVSGRRSEEVGALLGAAGVHYEGLYGMQGAVAGGTRKLLPSVEREAAAVPEAWVEDKGVSLAVHYRQAPDTAGARALLRSRLEPIAGPAGLEVVEGKMVLELVPAGRPMKGGAVERLIREHGLRAALYAGDDVADLDAFAALDRAAASGLLAVRVAVRGAETPSELVDAADIVVDGPRGLIALLGQLGA